MTDTTVDDATVTTGIPGVGELLALPPGPVDLGAVDPEGTPGFTGGKRDGKAALEAMADEMVELQTKLAADAYTGGHRRLLLVLQGMDTSGKGGVVKHAVGLFDAGGVRIRSFGAPTPEELAHDFLWRIERETPQAGQIGIFDRSHYEDVLIGRVRSLAPPEEIERRYGAINDFERRLVDDGTVVVKCLLHISADEQRERLLARLDDPRKRWKFRPEDVDDRALWDDYRAAYEVALERCSTEWAPWYVVPSNRKWYRTLAVASLLRDALRSMELRWPEPDYDVEEQRRRLEADDR
ncbi:PPK2 family polyphosphate kinase [Nocardioides caldifontis]|uniref:PPK2 family polyphosphate kinase n=1 Tax=Nocardioides caldifontis TaxID=2588938 RepID=UPI0011DF69B3|nr:PPK2 family polyphosphate kinase [Nocardioides caldifontis]